MNAPLDLTMDHRTFLHWVKGREGRFEFERGRVVQQRTGGSRNHSVLVVRSFPAEPQEVNGRAAVVSLAALDVKLPMADLFRGIGRTP